MEVVKQFNSELSSLYETKPPISKAKMTQITRSAMKAIKFYKHVVQSVEKFIQKCKAEYKVPGLYVIDSIVRQSRHQYTPEKDVFAPRFARNIQNTFLHLFNCTPEDKSKIVRVLNLWQKNNVFTADVIQPLLDLASAVAAREPPNGVPVKTPPVAQVAAAVRTPSPPRSPATIAWMAGARNPDFTKTLGKNSPAKEAWLSGSRNNDNNVDTKIAPVSAPKGLKMDKKMFEYDYGEDEDGDADGGSPRGGSTAPATPASQQNVSIESLSSILSNPEVLRQLHTLQQQMAARKQQQEMEEKMRRLQEMKHQEEEFDRHLAQTVPNLPFAAECELKPSGGGLEPPLMVPPPSQPPQSQFSQPMFSISDRGTDYDERSRAIDDMSRGQETESATSKDDSRSIEVIDLVRSPGRDDRRRRRTRSSSRSRGRRSRSRSRSRRHRSRSNDRDDRKWEGSRQREMDREKDRDRRKKGLPPIKKNHLTVCSTTLWVGHLSKLIQEDQLSNIFGEYGEIVSINVIPPRGCAFICMNRRQDAQKALHGLKYVKIQTKAITIAWAPGKGMKEKEWKDYWDVEVGASYIPWSKLSHKTDFALLEDGGTLDPDTFPEWLKEKYQSEGRSACDGLGGGKAISIVGSGNMNKAGLEDGELPPLPLGPQPPAIGVQPTLSQPPGMDTAPLPPPNLPPAAPAGPPLSLLPPPPFPMQPRLLGPMGAMPMGPGLVGNMPLGVPPPMMMAPPVVTRLPGPPHFNPPGMGFMGPMDKRDGMMGMGPPPLPSMPPMANPFGMPDHGYPGNHNDKGNHDPMEMDVVNDMDEDSTDRDHMSMQGGRGYEERDTDMRMDGSSGRDPDLPPEPFISKWLPIDKDRHSPGEKDMRSMMGGPHFDQFSSRPGRRDEDGPYPLMDFSRNQFFGAQRGRPRPLLRPPNGPMFNQRGPPPPNNDMSQRPHIPDWPGMGGVRGGVGDRGRGNPRFFGGAHPPMMGPPPMMGGPAPGPNPMMGGPNPMMGGPAPGPNPMMGGPAPGPNPMMGGPPPGPPMMGGPTPGPPPPGSNQIPLMGGLLPTPQEGPPPPPPTSRRRQDGERRSRWSAPDPPPPFPSLEAPSMPSAAVSNPSVAFTSAPPVAFTPSPSGPPSFTPGPSESAALSSNPADLPAPPAVDEVASSVPVTLYSPSGEDSIPASNNQEGQPSDSPTFKAEHEKPDDSLFGELPPPVASVAEEPHSEAPSEHPSDEFTEKPVQSEPFHEEPVSAVTDSAHEESHSMEAADNGEPMIHEDAQNHNEACDENPSMNEEAPEVSSGTFKEPLQQNESFQRGSPVNKEPSHTKTPLYEESNPMESSSLLESSSIYEETSELMETSFNVESVSNKEEEAHESEPVQLSSNSEPQEVESFENETPQEPLDSKEPSLSDNEADESSS